jgi:peptidoglycan/xylan/chitin deacetylase (PgdA/CDA1 family)
MNVLRIMKKSVLTTRGAGLFSLVARTTWRRKRLLILSYHGISSGDESGSHSEMFLPNAVFERRMGLLRLLDAHVLELGESLRLLNQGKLPPRSVVITFDDGWADFRTDAYPILQHYGYPATVYLTTYYCLFNKPIFRFAIAHMMWKQRSELIELHGHPWLPERLDLSTPAVRARLLLHIDAHAKQQGLSGKQKDELAAEFASIINFDYQAFTRQRLFCLMNPEEVSEIARGGIDIQLHTHRHRTPLDRDQFVREVIQNRRFIEEMTGENGRVHFCYPSGANRPGFLPWLRDASVQSATTCHLGLTTQTSNPLLLPRCLDQVNLIDAEFESWVTGFSAFLPKRKVTALDVAPE